MSRNTKERNGRGWLAAGFAGFSGATAIVTLPTSSGNWTIAQIAAAAVSIACAWACIVGERKQNGGLSILTLILVGLLAVIGAVPVWVEGIVWPQALPVAASILTLIFTFVARTRGRKSKSNWGSGSWV
jgi:hypothetical protein